MRYASGMENLRYYFLIFICGTLKLNISVFFDWADQMSIIELTLQFCTHDDAGTKFLLQWSKVMKLQETNFRHSRKDINSSFQILIFVMASSVCVWLEVVFRQNMSVRRAMSFWLTQEWHISIFVRVIQEILLIRKNKEIVLSEEFRPLHGFRELKNDVRIEYKISTSSSGGLRCFYYACFSNAWIIFINFNIFRFVV